MSLFLKSPILAEIPGILHGFGVLEEPVPQPLIPFWEASGPTFQQVHGTDTVWVEKPKQVCGEVDALITDRTEIPIGIRTADCVPILLSHRKGTCVAAIHAGWRGTRNHILQKTWEILQKKGEKSHSWVAAIGPSIGPCCYQVSSELAADFAREFADLGEGVAVPRDRILDLQAIHEGELKRWGFAKVEVLRFCTFCSAGPSFQSYRKKAQGRQWSVIMKTAQGRQ